MASGLPSALVRQPVRVPAGTVGLTLELSPTQHVRLEGQVACPVASGSLGAPSPGWPAQAPWPQSSPQEARRGHGLPWSRYGWGEGLWPGAAQAAAWVGSSAAIAIALPLEVLLKRPGAPGSGKCPRLTSEVTPVPGSGPLGWSGPRGTLPCALGPVPAGVGGPTGQGPSRSFGSWERVSVKCCA